MPSRDWATEKPQAHFSSQATSETETLCQRREGREFSGEGGSQPTENLRAAPRCLQHAGRDA